MSNQFIPAQGSNSDSIQNKEETNSTRRQFIKSSSAAVAAGVALPSFSIPQKTFAANDETIRVGLIGCGGRGTGAASQAMKADSNVMLTAMGDMYPDRLDVSHNALKKAAEEKIQVTPENKFTGFDAYKKVLESGVDLVILATPPGFRPMHLRAAVDAGKHIFCEKPMATDAPGLRSVIASANDAKAKKLALVAGFCWRYNFARRALYDKIHNGDIGDVRSIYATYYTGPVKPMPADDKRPAGMSDLDWQVRNWYNFTWLSGDSLVEQAIHSVDKVAWCMKDEPPVKAVATGGRQVPNESGNIFDHFAVYYEYANGLRAYVGSRQIAGCYNENNDYIHGAKGIAEILGWSRVQIRGEESWKYGGPNNDMYQTEHNELFASIRDGNPINDGNWMSSSTMMGIMGRMAAYTGKEISWEQAMNSQEKLVPEFFEPNMNLPIRPMSIPGATPFV
ncbi:Gfo/Idh/MocA family oxidoreductase [bacterium]|jgi:predicted dehydrogenase|nr:Gfo/Idh/MocA family oxidoreductase [Verrucomicrobiota bacterium]MDB4628307.1 Gfo/Idh/MocA family oxidoreductase [bacterium]MDB4777358.1 Gfo/Idh/MocA family oxidoreductase [Verrucomicrobiota bacterium]MDB4795130.1 Gfo/Idh/MocA family oxidoreductase [Verrucomicrobiota bacterium]MDB4803667.1 Gfo/Idh/MocA family oxidoreductase [Verrucomicrobiota bacterium]